MSKSFVLSLSLVCIYLCPSFQLVPAHVDSKQEKDPQCLPLNLFRICLLFAADSNQGALLSPTLDTCPCFHWLSLLLSQVSVLGHVSSYQFHRNRVQCTNVRPWMCPTMWQQNWVLLWTPLHSAPRPEPPGVYTFQKDIRMSLIWQV
jgi:hypothetical protein